jgi:hypothetical protein
VKKKRIDGRIDVTGRRGRRRKQLLDGLEESRGYCKLKVEALESTLWRTEYRTGYNIGIGQLRDDARGGT